MLTANAPKEIQLKLHQFRKEAREIKENMTKRGRFKSLPDVKFYTFGNPKSYVITAIVAKERKGNDLHVALSFKHPIDQHDEIEGMAQAIKNLNEYKFYTYFNNIDTANGIGNIPYVIEAFRRMKKSHSIPHHYQSVSFFSEIFSINDPETENE